MPKAQTELEFAGFVMAQNHVFQASGSEIADERSLTAFLFVYFC